MNRLAYKIACKIKDHVSQREPDVYVGGKDDPYMIRWWVIPRNKWFNIYLHHFKRSDEDRALHDHPWWNISYLIEGDYREHTTEMAMTSVYHGNDDEPYSEFRAEEWHEELKEVSVVKLRKAGQWAWRPATAKHRIELYRVFPHDRILPGSLYDDGWELPVWTLFITGRKVRKWGFWCKRGWIPWEEFTGQNEDNGPVRVAVVSKGCGEDDHA